MALQRFSDEDMDASILRATQKLGYASPTSDQLSAVKEFVRGKDVFVSLPTGAGKSLCFVMLPLVFDDLLSSTETEGALVLVISPLNALMRDQVKKYGSVLRCAYVGSDPQKREKHGQRLSRSYCTYSTIS